MIVSYLSKEVLDNMLRINSISSAAKTIQFWEETQGCYLGLLTNLENFTEPISSSYQRIDISAISQHPLRNDESYLKSVETNILDEETQAWELILSNQHYIMFPEALEDWGEIKGFGIFAAKEGTVTLSIDEETQVSAGNLPFLWGEITSDSGEAVVVSANEIPIFRENQFVIKWVNEDE